MIKLGKYKNKETLFLALIIFITLLLSHSPEIFAYFQTPPGYWFVGLAQFFNPWDHYYYLSKILQGYHGQWLSVDLYNPELLHPLPLFSFYIFLGHLSKASGISTPLIYQLSAVFLTVVYALLLNRFLQRFFNQAFWRLLALWLVMLGGGIGWAFFNVVYLPDISFPDATIFSTLTEPHFILDEILFLSIMMLATKRKNPFKIFIISILLGLIHPYSVASATAILGVYFLVLLLKRKFNQELLINILGLCAGLFAIAGFFYFFILDRLFGQNWQTRQNLQAGHPISYFLSYIPLDLLAFYAIFKVKNKPPFTLLLSVWFFVQFTLIYAPDLLQREMIKSWFASLAILAAVTLSNSRRKLVALYLVFLATFTPVLITVFRFYAVVNPLSRDWYYLPNEERQAFDWLSKNSPPFSVVLATEKRSVQLFTVSRNRVFSAPSGGLVEQKDNNRKFLNDFFKGGPGNLGDVIKNRKIDYVYFGPAEKIMAGKNRLDYPFLIPVYENSNVIIYKLAV